MIRASETVGMSASQEVDAGPALVIAPFRGASVASIGPVYGPASCLRAFTYWEPLEAAAQAAGIPPEYHGRAPRGRRVRRAGGLTSGEPWG